MKISHDWLQSYFKEKIPSADKLSELFNMHAFEVEGVEKQSGDTVLDIKVLPDRAHYALSHRGIAQEVQVITGLKMSAIHPSAVHVEKTVVSPDVKIYEKKLCNRYVACRINDVVVEDSPDFLKEKIEVLGQRSINTIVDATNFVMFDIGQPLHAFDAAKVKGDISVRLAKAGEKIIILDGREMSLVATDLIIADDVGPLAIAGVKGGKRAEVTSETKDIILESANFNATAIRKTATRLALRNESSKRFENEITPDLCLEAMRRVADLIVKLSKDARVGTLVDVYPQQAVSWSVSVTPEYVSSVIGIDVPKKEIQAILERMHCHVTEDAGQLVITPPLNRLDLKIPEDIADEIGRIYGYEKLPSVLPPNIKDNITIDKTFYYAEKVKSLLVEKGFSETLLYTLVPKGTFEIAYPLASDKAALRERIVPKLQEALIMNSRNADLLELEAVKIFEIGKVFPSSGEKLALSIGVSVIRKKKGFTAESVLKEAIAHIEKELQITIAQKVEVGEFGACIEIDFGELVSGLPEAHPITELHFAILPKDKKYELFSPYPFASRDVAVFVPKGHEEAEVSKVIEKHAGKYLLKMKLFDVFHKEESTSYAFRLIFQSPKKTLEEGEINGAMEDITNALNGKKGWSVR